MGEVTKGTIYSALKDVFDPEIPVSIVDLGLIYDIKIIDNWVGVKMTLTTPGCILANQIAEMVHNRIIALPEVSTVDVRIVWQPPWTPSMMSDEAKRVVQLN